MLLYVLYHLQINGPGLFDLFYSNYDLKKRLSNFSNFSDAIQEKRPVHYFQKKVMVVNGFKLSSSIPILPFKKTWKQKLALKLVVSTIMWIILGHFSQICGLPTVTLHQLGIVYRPYPPQQTSPNYREYLLISFQRIFPVPSATNAMPKS